jgi:hypothetical protein
MQITLQGYLNTRLTKLRAEQGHKVVVELWYSRKSPGHPESFRQNLCRFIQDMHYAVITGGDLLSIDMSINITSGATKTNLKLECRLCGLWGKACWSHGGILNVPRYQSLTRMTTNDRAVVKTVQAQR